MLVQGIYVLVEPNEANADVRLENSIFIEAGNRLLVFKGEHTLIVSAPGYRKLRMPIIVQS